MNGAAAPGGRRGGRGAIPAALLLLAAMGGGLSAAAKPLQFRFFAHYGHSWLTPNPSSPWNPGGAAALPQRDSRLLLQPDALWHRGVLKLQLSPVFTMDHDGTTRTRLREGAATLNLGKVEITAGKSLVKLGTGYMFTPISVITPARQVADPEDTSHAQEGVNLVKADYFSENLTLSLIAFEQTNWRNFALFAYTTVKRVDLYAVLYYPEYRRLCFGLAAATAIGESVEVHGEFMVRHRRPHPDHLVFHGADPHTTFDRWPLVAAADEAYVEFLVGANLTFRGFNLIAEYYHTDSSLRRGQYNALREHFLYNAGRMEQPHAAANAAADIERVRAAAGGLQRDFLFLRLWKAWKSVDASAILFLSPVDGSYMALAEVVHALNDHVSWYIRPLFFSGRRGGEFRDGFYSSMLQLGFRVSL